MLITICGSIKFMEEMKKVSTELIALGHEVLMPIKADGVDYWSKDRRSRVEAKRDQKLMQEHLDKIVKSDAILAVNVTKNDIEYYIGANTFVEMVFAYYKDKKVFLLNPIPDQPYIIDEIETINPTVINGNLNQIQ